MFPLGFPYAVLKRRAGKRQWVLDPFSGRGTTNYAARSLGLPSLGVDSSPVAAALTRAKLANTSPHDIVGLAKRILADESWDDSAPRGEFWSLAYESRVLRSLSRLRSALRTRRTSPASDALTAVVLGALHGPMNKGAPWYFSNQSPRTYSPKPNYAVGYWRRNAFLPPKVDVLDLIERRAHRYYAGENRAEGRALQGDSRDPTLFAAIEERFSWIVTSPPYYGMRTYVPDQWIRSWFLGGPPTVEYHGAVQVVHRSPAIFSQELRQVWLNTASVAADGARMVIRFGTIGDRLIDARELIRESLHDTPWIVQTVRGARTSDAGKRQAWQFTNPSSDASQEFDVWTKLHA